ncbi:hypothetical protein [Shimia aestuarii]|uniref:hypothetical protein n=1 Tax=Shimia aestuarii TaxID=254406 RepID=UPI001FB5298E|nr:hypothetical protein [Shimia aestuarii]
MGRLLIHAGFHKTGTTSVQRLLAKNKRVLAPLTHVFLRKHLDAACDAARAYSASRKASDLLAFSAAIAEFLEQRNLEDSRDIIISTEDLSGLMPGRRDLRSYDAAPILMKALTMMIDRTVGDHFDEVIFYFSLRKPAPWLRSCHTQHLRAIRMTLDEADYAREYADSANLPRIVDKVRIAAAPHRVESAWLEDCADAPLGPLTPIADLLGWPEATRDALNMLPPANVSLPPELRAEFLEINRATEDHDEMRKAKEAARRRHGKARPETAKH